MKFIVVLYYIPLYSYVMIYKLLYDLDLLINTQKQGFIFVQIVFFFNIINLFPDGNSFLWVRLDCRSRRCWFLSPDDWRLTICVSCPVFCARYITCLKLSFWDPQQQQWLKFMTCFNTWIVRMTELIRFLAAWTREVAESRAEMMTSPSLRLTSALTLLQMSSWWQ